MKVVYGYECDFCGQVKPIVCTTHGCYCRSCFQLIIDECAEALDVLWKTVDAAFEEEENESIG